VVTNLESLLLRLAEKSSHVHITERVLYTEVQRKGSVAYHRDPAAVRFDLPFHPLFGHPTQSWQAIGQSQTEHLRKTVQMLSPKTSWWLLLGGGLTFGVYIIVAFVDLVRIALVSVLLAP